VVRDRFGIKPLYYIQQKGVFCFASELKALVHFPFKKSIDKAALQAYFHLNYIPSPLSIYDGVRKLMPGHWMKIDLNGNTATQRYYEVKAGEKTTQTFNEAKTELRNLLETSVQRRMVADVPLGTFLSGGIDSSIITAIASQNTKHLQSFSIGFADEPLFDETAYARLMANQLKTEHTVFSLRNADLYAHLFDMLDYLDEPFADSSALAVYILSKETRKHVTVALSGDGADEIFAGYNKHAAELKIREKSISNALLSYTSFLLPFLPKSRNSAFGNKFRQLEKYVNGLKWSAPERYWQWARWAGLSEKGLLKNEYTDEVRYQALKEDCLKACNDEFDSVLRTDLRLVLENDMLVKTDRMSMANSLEMRVPFLDHAIVDFAFTLPTEYKINKAHRKHILKEAFADQLPQELFNRGKKGFEVPLLRWFQGELKSLIEDDLLSRELVERQGIFNYSIIEMVKNKLYSNSPNDAVEQIWALLVFQIWWKKNHPSLEQN
jgi:asparagine synthase (glutamine-hydrolysing)